MVLHAVLVIFWLCLSKIWCSTIEIEKNGYKNMLIVLPRHLLEEERVNLIRNLEDMIKLSSVLLQTSTKGRAYFAEVSIIVPNNWKIPDDDPSWKLTSFNSTAFLNPQAAMSAEEADVVITDGGQYPYVLHQDGCAQKAMRIILPKDFLLKRGEKETEFLRLWAEYRYGVFPEGGFQDDDKYPIMYRTSDGKEMKPTKCSDKSFWSSSSKTFCVGEGHHCKDIYFSSSLMDQHESSSATLFCEGSVGLGPKHNPDPPSKHNILCKDEGTWFTVMRSPDFSRGRNAAPRSLQRAADVSFRFYREPVSPRIIVAIEVSQRMKPQRRFNLVQIAFYQFVYTTLPYGSDVTLLVFGGEEEISVAQPSTVLKGEDSRILYIESQPLPEDPSDSENVSLSQLFEEIFQVIEDANDFRKTSSEIILVTTESYLNSSTYKEVRQKMAESGSRLHVMLFPGVEKPPNLTMQKPLRDLCLETRGEFVSLHTDPLGDLSRGLATATRNYNKEVLILQGYLKADDNGDLEVSFIVDDSLTENLKVSLTFPHMKDDILEYRETVLQTPSGNYLNFMKLDFLWAWVVDLTQPETGKYTVKTRRKDGFTTPVLITVYGRPSTADEPITVNVWGETVHKFDITPQPVRLYAEVKKGWNPIKNVHVTALVSHPGGETSVLTMVDDGLGDVDITKNDGIYGRYYTNFTASGYYNVYLKVSQRLDTPEVMKGPSGFCCGSFFSAFITHPLSGFLREAGPFTFYVQQFNTSLTEDRYPPARITDLRVVNLFDRICILHWTAVGDDFDSGYAERYELKVFRDKAAIQNRFSGSGQELYSEMVGTTEEAVYGTTLNHAFELPSSLKADVYYIAVRAVDDSGNAGETSNVVSVLIEQSSTVTITCDDTGDS